MIKRDETTIRAAAEPLIRLLRAATPDDLRLAAAEPPLLALPAAPDPAVATVMANIAGRDPSVQAGLRRSYESAFSFIWPGYNTPWAGITEDDIRTVLAVAAALHASPASVLALWIHEGKWVWNDQFHGVSSDFGARFGASVDMAAGHNCGGLSNANRQPAPTWISSSDFRRLRAWALAAVLDCFFGLDYFTRRDLSEAALAAVPVDAQPEMVRRHFTAAAGELMALAAVEGWTVLARPATPEGVLRYFVDVGGALAVTVNSAGAVVYAICKASIPSWLVLQAGLFEQYGVNFASRLGVAGPLDPWVTYWAFNGGVERIATQYFGTATNDAAVRERIAATFDPASPGFRGPTADEIAAFAQGDPDYRMAKPGAIVHKFLIESVAPFFAGI